MKWIRRRAWCARHPTQGVWDDLEPARRRRRRDAAQLPVVRYPRRRRARDQRPLRILTTARDPTKEVDPPRPIAAHMQLRQRNEYLGRPAPIIDVGRRLTLGIPRRVTERIRTR